MKPTFRAICERSVICERKFTLYILIDTVVWLREPHSNLQAAMVAWKILRAEGHTCFVVVT